MTGFIISFLTNNHVASRSATFYQSLCCELQKPKWFYFWFVLYIVPNLPISSILVTVLSSSFLISTLLLSENGNDGNHAYSTFSKDCAVEVCEEVTVDDDNLKVEIVSSGLKFPTTMAFLGDNDILVLERFNGDCTQNIG